MEENSLSASSKPLPQSLHINPPRPPVSAFLCFFNSPQCGWNVETIYMWLGLSGNTAKQQPSCINSNISMVVVLLLIIGGKFENESRIWQNCKMAIGSVETLTGNETVREFPSALLDFCDYSVSTIKRKGGKKIMFFFINIFYLTVSPLKPIFFMLSRFNMDIRHIKITSAEGLFRINDKKAFKGLIVCITMSNLAIISNHQSEEDATSLFQHIWNPDCLSLH